MGLRLLHCCLIRSRCPCCGEGPLFAGALRFRKRCPSCGLDYDQWVGEWITPTCIAASAGFLVGVGLTAAMLATGAGLNAWLPPEIAVSSVAASVALLLLRPAKSGWLAFLYWIGAVEVSARTRAHLRWRASPEGEAGAAARSRAAEGRARSPRPLPQPNRTPRRVSLRRLLFPLVGLGPRRRGWPGAPRRRPGSGAG